MTTKTSFFQKIPLDVRVCAVMFLAAVYLFVDSRGYPDKAILFPTIMLVLIMVLSAYCMAASVIKQQKALRAKAEGAAEKKKAPVDLKAVCILAVMSAAYAFFTPYIGFGLSSLIFIAAGAIFFGEKDIRAIVAVPAGTMIFVYAFFIRFLDVSIPFFPSIFTS